MIKQYLHGDSLFPLSRALFPSLCDSLLTDSLVNNDGLTTFPVPGVSMVDWMFLISKILLFKKKKEESGLYFICKILKFEQDVDSMKVVEVNSRHNLRFVKLPISPVSDVFVIYVGKFCECVFDVRDGTCVQIFLLPFKYQILWVPKVVSTQLGLHNICWLRGILDKILSPLA